MMVEIPEHIQRLLPYCLGMPIEDLAGKKKPSRIVKLAPTKILETHPQCPWKLYKR